MLSIELFSFHLQMENETEIWCVTQALNPYLFLRVIFAEKDAHFKALLQKYTQFSKLLRYSNKHFGLVSNMDLCAGKFY